MVDHARARKLGELIKVIVAQALERGVIKDTRLGFVTITDVRMTGDLQHASIFYTVYGTDEEREETTQEASRFQAIPLDMGWGICSAHRNLVPHFPRRILLADLGNLWNGSRCSV